MQLISQKRKDQKKKKGYFSFWLKDCKSRMKENQIESDREERLNVKIGKTKCQKRWTEKRGKKCDLGNFWILHV